MAGYDVVVCGECESCFADKIPIQTYFDNYYREKSKYEFLHNMGHVSKYDQSRSNKMAMFLKRTLINHKYLILEIGCSTGALLSILKQNGYEIVIGVDPSPACSEVAKRLYGIEVLTHTFSNICIADGSINVIILVGVIEHIRDLKTTLQKCWNMLPDNGLIYIVVPDASRYYEGEDAPFQEFSIEHINFFGPDSLTNLLTINGFTKLTIELSIIETNYRTTTPIIQGIYKKNKKNNLSSILTDIDTRNGLNRYIEQSRQMNNIIIDKIAELVSNKKPIIVWGKGSHTLRLLTSSKSGEANIRAFVDSNPKYQGKVLNNIPIVYPQTLKEYSDPILTSSRVYQQEIVEYIRNEIHNSNEVIVLYYLFQNRIERKIL